MKGPETPSRAQRPPEASQRRICSTYMKGRKTSMSLLTRNLFYLYEGPRDAQSLQRKGTCSTYTKGRETSKSLLTRQFVLPI